MLSIKKRICDKDIDFAAEELKKYIGMMMPDKDDIQITLDPKADCGGFVLGLMQDFRFDVSDVEDPEKNDIIYVYTGYEHGIIAGSNPHAVLLSVYEFLRQQGCQLSVDGNDSENIPTIERFKQVRYRHVV